MKAYVRPSVVAMGNGFGQSLSKACPKGQEWICGILFRT